MCAKKRGAGDARTVVYAGGDIPDKHDARANYAIIVDDLCQTGSTTAECARLLRENFAHVSAFVVHAVFPCEAYRHFLAGGKYAGVVDEFFVCNTNPSASDVLARVGAPFAVLDVAPLIGAQLRKDAAPRLALATVTKREAARDCRSAFLASRSALKERALGAAFERCRAVSVPAIFASAVASRVGAQPLSEREAWRGAENRLAALKAQPRVERDCLYVAVESGLWQRDGAWADSACVIVERAGAFAARARVLSAPHKVPARYLDAYLTALLSARGATTLGALVHAADASVPADEWFDRATQIADAIALALESL